MAQWIGMLSVFPEDMRSVPSIHIRQIPTTYNCCFGGSDDLFQPPKVPVYICTHTPDHPHEY